MERKVHFFNFRAISIRNNRFVRLGILTLVSCCLLIMLRTSLQDKKIQFIPNLSDYSPEEVLVRRGGGKILGSSEVELIQTSSQSNPDSKSIQGTKTSDVDENDQVRQEKTVFSFLTHSKDQHLLQAFPPKLKFLGIKFISLYFFSEL